MLKSRSLLGRRHFPYSSCAAANSTGSVQTPPKERAAPSAMGSRCTSSDCRRGDIGRVRVSHFIERQPLQKIREHFALLAARIPLASP